MVQTLEVIKGGGGSIRVGTTGKIGSLMTRELDSVKCTSPSPISSRRRPPTIPVSVSCGVTTRRLQARRASSQYSSSSSSIKKTSHKNIESTLKTRRNVQKRNMHRIPILGSDNFGIERTPNREKPVRKGSHIAEVVDIKCGNPDRWSSSSNPIANRFKKLGFSKLSEGAR